ncbi:MAG: glycoside hydrolase family 9 protein [Nannocystales bacterium]
MKTFNPALLLALVAGCGAADASNAPGSASVATVHDDGPAPIIDGDHNLIRNGAFEDGTLAPWKASMVELASGRAELDDGALCVALDAGGETAWDAQVRHRALTLTAGHAYRVEFSASATPPTQLWPKVAQVGPPYDEYWASQVEVGTEPQRFVGHFIMRGEDDAAELSFLMGGPLAAKVPTRVCFDDVALSDPEYTPPPPPDHLRAPPIRVNQVGYLPSRPKFATLRDPGQIPVAWALLDAEGVEVATGMTTVFGPDVGSGEHVHWVDFSSVKTTGEGYVVRVGEEQSDAFAIQGHLYRSMKLDALRFFFHNRSGTEIAMPFAGEARWARGAGHQSDRSVSCQPALDCTGTFDVSGGWYDAGDHGKYVVNAGIAVWTLLNAYERMTEVGAGANAFADGTANIPESGNGTNDLLDEVRWELEFLLRMQVPAGHPKWAGMAFHKVHEEAWAGLPLSPPDATDKRFLHRPSTAATLNLAAVTAQAARVYETIDPTFARRCLTASKRAYAAAKTTPDLHASGDDNVGGGPYEDSRVSDEFYWAAIELYLSTGDAQYRKDAQGEHFGVVLGPTRAQGGHAAPMNWQLVGSLGTLSLATAGARRAPADAKAAREAVVAVARSIAKQVEREGYRVPLAPDGAGNYPWGSNSLVLNNAVVLGLGYAFSKDDALLDATAEAMNYILGRNPVWQSYVTGYGANPLENPHHRFWAKQKDPDYPGPPPGIVSGGPNSAIQDPYAKSAGLGGCPAQRCFVDHIESWSTNEIAINWNAPLVWVLAFLDETSGANP